jgi:DNA-binding transcriptional ArsR family regulator
MKIDPDLMHTAAGRASEMLKSLSNPHRLMILCQLLEGERSVGDLAVFLDLRSSTVSQHLALLRRDDLVVARRDGQTIWYGLASTPAQKILETLFVLYCAPQAEGTDQAGGICRSAALSTSSLPLKG